MKKQYENPIITVLSFDVKDALMTEVGNAMSELVDFGEEVEEW